MNRYMWQELDKIAREMKNGWVFQALDKLAQFEGPGDPSEPPMVSSHSAADREGGVSATHCDKCFGSVPKEAKFCPGCGKKAKAARDLQTPPKEKAYEAPKMSPLADDKALDSGSTGGPESVSEELAEGSYQDTGKYAYSMLLQKHAAPRLYPQKVNPALSLKSRGRVHANVDDAMESIRRSTMKYTKRLGGLVP